MIQAQSLGDLLQLADDPPLQYHAEQWTDQDCLTLYFARVPGSKDFFLTTIKPLDKIVRAGDVEGCLYYVHLSTEKDAEILRKAEESLVTEYPDAFPSMTGIAGQKASVRRKPVLTSTRSSQPVPGRTLDATSMPRAPKESVLLRKPVGPENAKARGQLPSKPLGPRPLHGRHAGLQERDGNKSIGIWNDQPTSSSLQPHFAVSNRDPYTAKQEDLESLYSSNSNIDNPFAGSRSSSESASAESFVTLIRRYDGMQSNVGEISASGAIQMQSEGYRKFPVKHDVSANGAQRISIDTRLNPLVTGSGGPETSRQSLSDGYGVDLRKQPNKGTHFSTPWGSQCHFTASIGGRSLQCIHEDPNLVQPSAVSELRFNLPSSQALRSTPRLPITPETTSKRASLLRLHHRSKSDNNSNASATELEQERMDLSLGQELAGGGFGGQKAKLGKLIIRREGFAFLDLLVITNIAMWLKIYDKTTRADF